jgi:hypothetical protein
LVIRVFDIRHAAAISTTAALLIQFMRADMRPDGAHGMIVHPCDGG